MTLNLYFIYMSVFALYVKRDNYYWTCRNILLHTFHHVHLDGIIISLFLAKILQKSVKVPEFLSMYQNRIEIE